MNNIPYARKLQMADLTGGLTEQQRVFVVYYCQDRNGKRAAEMCGISPSTGYRWLEEDEHVQRAIYNLTQHLATQTQYNAEWVQEQLAENHFIARYEGNINASNAALNSIGKLASVKAFDNELVVVGADALVERLQRGRQRVAQQRQGDEPAPPQDSGDEPLSFI